MTSVNVPPTTTAVAPPVTKPADHWYGWVVSVCVFLVQFGVFGTMNSYSTFSHDLETDSSIGSPSSTDVSFGNALANGIAPILTIFAGAIADRLGHRLCLALCAILCSVASFGSSYAQSLPAFIALYSIPMCLCSAFLSSPGAAAVSSWMEKNLAFGMGIAYSGNGAGSSVIVLLAGYLAGSNLGWRVSFRYMAICPAIALVASLFVVTRTPLRSRAVLPPEERRFIKNLMTSRQFWYLWLASAFFSYAFFSILYVIVPFGADFGRAGTPYEDRASIGIKLAVTLFTWFGAFKWGFSVILGALAKMFGTTVIFCVGSTILFVSCCLWPTCSNYTELAVVVSFIGIGVAGIFATLPSLTAQHFGGPFGGLALGFVTSAYAVGGFLGPPVTEAIRNSQGGVYTWAFVAMAVGVMVAGFFIGVMIRRAPAHPVEWAQTVDLLTTIPSATNDASSAAPAGTKQVTDYGAAATGSQKAISVGGQANNSSFATASMQTSKDVAPSPAVNTTRESTHSARGQPVTPREGKPGVLERVKSLVSPRKPADAAAAASATRSSQRQLLDDEEPGPRQTKKISPYAVDDSETGSVNDA